MQEGENEFLSATITFCSTSQILKLRRGSSKVMDGAELRMLADKTVKMVVTGLEVSY